MSVSVVQFARGLPSKFVLGLLFCFRFGCQALDFNAMP